MPKGYSLEMANEYMKQQAEAKATEDQSRLKKMDAQIKQAAVKAEAAINEAAMNRETLDSLRSEVARAHRMAFISIVIAIICMAMVMADELSQMMAMLP